MEEEISTKSKKSDILKAYNELLARLEEQREPDRQAERKVKEEEAIVEKASQHSVETIVRNLADSKLSLVKALDELEEQLIAEHRKLTGIREAIEIEERNLETVHEIRASADSLAALLLAQKEKKAEFEAEMEQEKEAFEQEMAEKRLQWKKEQESIEQSGKEKVIQAEKERAREEEEYAYELQLSRKKDSDAYDAEKAALEKELQERRESFEKDISEREAAVTEKEREYSELAARVESFPAELEKAVGDAVNATRREMELTYGHEAELTRKEMESERKLSEQTISALEAKIKEQEEQVRQLARKADESGLQVQNIAVKAIEGASSQRIVVGGYEKNKE